MFIECKNKEQYSNNKYYLQYINFKTCVRHCWWVGMDAWRQMKTRWRCVETSAGGKVASSCLRTCLTRMLSNLRFSGCEGDWRDSDSGCTRQPWGLGEVLRLLERKPYIEWQATIEDFGCYSFKYGQTSHIGRRHSVKVTTWAFPIPPTIEQRGKAQNWYACVGAPGSWSVEVSWGGVSCQDEPTKLWFYLGTTCHVAFIPWPSLLYGRCYSSALPFGATWTFIIEIQLLGEA